MPDEISFDDATWYRALTLRERIALLRESAMLSWRCTRRSSDGEERLRAWRETRPFDDDEIFAEWLAELGVDQQELEVALRVAPEHLAELTSEPPSWLARLARAYGRPPGDEAEIFPGASELDPAEMGVLELLRPLIAEGVETVREGLRSQLAGVSDGRSEPPFEVDHACRLIARQLPSRLLAICGRTMMLELNVARLSGELEGDSGEERFRSFIDRLRRPAGAVSLLSEYPVLARAAVRSIDRWVAGELELTGRLCADWALLQQRFPAVRGRLVELFGGAGDLHRGGRSVHILRFASGGRLVYKPRALSGERRFQELIEWFNGKGDHLSLRPIEILDRGDYGWVEFLEESEECSSEDQVRRFYERQGYLLALLYALESNDFHYQNLIATGEHPVAIDLESILQPRLAEREGSSTEGAASTSVTYSVSRTGLLPRRAWAADDYGGVDISGLGGAEGQLTPHGGIGVDDRGRDTMRMVSMEQRLPRGRHRPVLDGEQVDVLGYADELLAGFETAYSILSDHRGELLGPDGLIGRFASDEVRVITRPTRTYTYLLTDSFHPDFLRDALDRDRHFDKLWVGRVGWSDLSRIIPSERAQLEAGDIPLFYAHPGGRELYAAGGRPFERFFATPPLEHVRRRLEGLGERDLELQTWVIRACLAILEPDAGHGRSAGYALDLGREAELSAERALDAARSIGERLAHLSFESVDGSVSWIGLKDDFQRYVAPSTVGVELYDGLTGIALFLAHLAEMTGEGRFEDLARAALASAERLWSPDDPRLELELQPVGAFSGWGGLLLAQLGLATLWGEERLVAGAEEICRRLPDLAREQASHDVVRGTAGALAAVLALDAVRPSPDTLAVARALGDRIVAAALPRGGGLAWPTGRPGEPPLAGFSHGASGIAWALLGLAERTGDDRYWQVADRALVFERSLFMPELGNWKDLRVDVGEGAIGLAWCHGAPGIGLARASRLGVLERDGVRPDLREEIRVALEATVRGGFGGNQSLCHGDLGNLELLFEAGRVLGEPEWSARADALAAAIVGRIERHGPRCGLPGGLENPGLMTGLAGIGYGLLRLADREQVPSVLLLELPRTAEPTAAARRPSAGARVAL